MPLSIRAGNATPNLGRIDKAGTDAGIVALAGGISSRFLTLFSPWAESWSASRTDSERKGLQKRLSEK